MTLAALSAAIAFCFSGGLLAMLAQIVTAALMMAYALTGFAVLHTLTLALKSRALWLGCTYAVVVVFGWLALLAMAALGLADAVFGLRQRYLQGEAAAPPRVLNSYLQLNLHRHHLKGERIWKSFCWNASPSSARWAKSSASRTDLPAIFS